MTLAEIRRTFPKMFYPNQTWFDGEAFMDIDAQEITRPNTLMRINPDTMGQAYAEKVLQHAATWAALYVDTCNDPLWQNFLWTKDLDRFGQRVYVGGVDQGNVHGFQIHRHLRIDNKWAVPEWG